jgi:hypothetical protein
MVAAFFIDWITRRRAPTGGAPVAVDLGLVADAAQREADELPPVAPMDWPSEVLPTPRSDEAEDRALWVSSACGPRGTEDALLHLSSE